MSLKEVLAGVSNKQLKKKLIKALEEAAPSVSQEDESGEGTV